MTSTRTALSELRLSICDASEFRDEAQQILNAALKLPSIDAVGIYAFDAHGALQLVSGRGVSAEFTAEFTYFAPNSYQAQEVLKGEPIVRTIGQLPPERARPYIREGLRGIAVFPMKHKDRVVGSLNLGTRSHDTIPGLLYAELQRFAASLAGTIVRISREARMYVAYHEIEKKIRTRTVALQQAIDALNQEMAAREQAQIRLRQSVSLLRATLESTADGLLVVDRAGTITGYNSRFTEMWSIPEEILETRNDARALEHVRQQLKDPDAFFAKVQQLYAAPESESHDTVEFTDGRIFERYSRPQYVAGEAVGRVWSFRDVTLAKRYEEELKENARRKDEFLAMLGHELRNPLAPIRNASHILKLTGGDDPRIQNARTVIERQVTHLSRIVDDLLEASRMALGKIVLKKERVDWTRIVRAIVEDHGPEFEQQGLELCANLPPHPLYVFGDATRLSQVVANLMANAQKFSNPGGQISVNLCYDPQTHNARLAVADTGIGMTPETLKTIFDRFVQAEKDLARSRGGLGLGLALVRGLVELHGGSVDACSAGLGCGSTLTIELPVLELVPAGSA